MAESECKDVQNKSPKKRKNRGIVWEDEVVNILIDLWGEESIQIALENSKSAKETREVYRRIKVQLVTIRVKPRKIDK